MQTFSQLIEPALGSVGLIRDRCRYDPNRLDLVCILARNWTLNLSSKLVYLSRGLERCCRMLHSLYRLFYQLINLYVAHNKNTFIHTHS